MKPIHAITSSLLALALACAAQPAMAAAAVAAGDGNYTYTVTEADSIEQAKKEALENCSAKAANCEVLVWTAEAEAIAIAKGDRGVSVSARATPEQARKAAMAECSKQYGNCRFAALYWEPGSSWAAFAMARGEDGGSVASNFSYDNRSEEQASQMAIAACEKNLGDQKKYKCELVQTFVGDWTYAKANSPSYMALSIKKTREQAVADAIANCKKNSNPGDTCKITATFANAGPKPQPKSFNAVAALADSSRHERRPVGPVARPTQALTCTNHCVNGSCVRTFPNGRKEHWQAPRVFDPFTNDWKWDTNSCGG